LRRQATALRLAYQHAVLHATRPFLLLTRRRQQEAGEDQDEGESEVAECISAASHLLSTFDGMAAAGGAVFHALWWSSYVVFCALSVVYVCEIQRRNPTSPSSSVSLREHGVAKTDMARLMDLAERCRGHLSQARAANSPSKRYSIILEELRAEARARTVPPNHGVSGRGAGLPLAAVQAPSDTHDAVTPSFAADYVPQVDDEGWAKSSDLLMGWQTSDWLDLDSSVGFHILPVRSSEVSR
jgi:hypothetical protein